MLPWKTAKKKKKKKKKEKEKEEIDTDQHLLNLTDIHALPRECYRLKWKKEKEFQMFIHIVDSVM